MKTLYNVTLTFLLLFSSYSDSFSQLHGNYTIGQGGDFPTIDSAVTAISFPFAIIAPVTFNIITGIYNEVLNIGVVPGSSPVNTVTFQSQTGNMDDVTINGFHIIGASNLIFQNVTIAPINNILFYSNRNIDITRVNFNSMSLNNFGVPTIGNNLRFTGNKNFGGMIYDEIHIVSRNLQFRNNEFTNRIWLDHCDSVLFEGNKFTGNIPPGRRNLVFVGSSDIYFYKNRVEASGGSGNLGFAFCSGKLFMYNNFFYGYTTDCFGMDVGFTDANIIYNTFYLSSLNIVGGANPGYYFFNNLMLNSSGGWTYTVLNTLPSYSDYNNFYNTGSPQLLYYSGVSYGNVPDFTNASTLDSHSTSVPVTFVSPTDLHLAGSSIGDDQLAGIPTALVTDDIDGQPRNPYHPYKGADEIVDFPLPVELASFTSSVISNNVYLKWTTLSEINNSGFDIQRIDTRRETQDVWKKIGFVKGNGIINSTSNYEFTNKNLLPGKYNYRLKQIDLNGNFEYYNLSNEVVIRIPTEYNLSQNYPNPFNPKTIINFSLPDAHHTVLKIYDASGKEVETLLNKNHEAGEYNVEWNASDFSSGIYFYSLLVDGNIIGTKRMILLK